MGDVLPPQRRRRRFVLAAIAAALFAVRADAAPATARVDGREVDASKPISLRAGQRLETGPAGAAVRSAGGDEIRVAPRSVLRHEGAEGAAESFFVASGSAEGTVGARTHLGTSGGWATAPAGASARVRVAATADGATGGGSFRAADAGGVWVRFHAVATWVPARCEATCTPGAGGPGSVSVAAGASNAASVETSRATSDATHAASVPAGATVVLSDRGAATRFVCGAAGEGSRVRVELRRGARAVRTAAIGAGAAAVLEPAGLRIELPALPAEALRELLDMDGEFKAL